MKKLIVSILVIGILLTVTATAAFAGCHRAGRNFVDADGDGVCDMADDRCAYVDADDDGVCDNAGSRPAFVDADGDGVCDHAASPQRQGCGAGQGHHGGGFRAGHGCGFRGGRGR